MNNAELLKKMIADIRLEDDEDYDNECKQWIDILSDINKYSIC